MRASEAGTRPVHALSDGQLAEIIRQAEAGYPEEICGIVLGRPGAPETYRVRQARNVANEQPQKDPTGTERDARTAYSMDGRDIQRIQDEADQAGCEFLIFYHSHPDHDAYFSAMDRERALLPSGDPFWPSVSHLVMSVRAGRVRDARSYSWDDTGKDFVEAPVVLPAGPGRQQAGTADPDAAAPDPGGASSPHAPHYHR